MKPATTRSRVDLPEPEGPTIATLSPFLTSRSIGPRVKPPKDYLTTLRERAIIFLLHRVDIKIST